MVQVGGGAGEGATTTVGGGDGAGEVMTRVVAAGAGAAVVATGGVGGGAVVGGLPAGTTTVVGVPCSLPRRDSSWRRPEISRASCSLSDAASLRRRRTAPATNATTTSENRTTVTSLTLRRSEATSGWAVVEVTFPVGRWVAADVGS